jgi:DNA-binding protein HU-beta
VNKAQLIEALSAYYDGSKAEAAKALNAVVQTITYKTAGGEKVSITGFGVFEKVARAARMVRNPRTGERKRAKATAVPRFRAGSDLKAYVSGAKKVPKATAKKAAPATKAAPAKARASKTAPTKKAAAKAPARKAPTKKAAAKH